jgi:hypothetical protein
MLLVGRHTTADIHLDPDVSRAVRMRMELGVRFVSGHASIPTPLIGVADVVIEAG